MKLSILSLACLLAVACAAPAVSVGAPLEGVLHSRFYYETRFQAWMDEYGSDIPADEYHTRLQNFARADDKIARHNADPGQSFTMAHNQFSHLTWEEFRAEKGLGRPMPTKPATPFRTQVEAMPETARRLDVDDEEVPDEVDWRKKGAVTPVKDQGSCGSCWSFSTTGSMEGAYFLKTKKLVSFSEQMLVDCDSYDSGCGGGLMDFSFHWIQENGGICAEADYPYEAINDQCKSDACKVVPGTNVASWVDVDQDMKSLMKAVKKQPVSVAIEADESAFQFYSGGVLMNGCGTSLDHGVLLVGYGTTEDGVDYWTLKNSWGPSWGDAGYIRVLRGAPQEGGECGILQSASYPVLFK
ncbi:hypothetical protein JKP88DRAFT_231214 [Tribonema minus]|uniref:Uncharacterized protein n=1 Tax=Tribonema minus TaxID=303371 RepID=A0A835ZFS5_9STRA|nr:hypothetical protein JKP88DRAFT_231214 [Tribonema minus]